MTSRGLEKGKGDEDEDYDEGLVERTAWVLRMELGQLYRIQELYYLKRLVILGETVVG